MTEAVRDGVCPVCGTSWPTDSLAESCDHRRTPHASAETIARWGDHDAVRGRPGAR